MPSRKRKTRTSPETSQGEKSTPPQEHSLGTSASSQKLSSVEPVPEPEIISSPPTSDFCEALTASLREASLLFQKEPRHSRMGEEMGSRGSLTVSIPELIDTFFTGGEKPLGPGKLIVPRNFDFRVGDQNSWNSLHLEVTAGYPTFKGEAFFKLIPLHATFTGITADRELRTGWIKLSGFIDLPFTLKR